MRKKKVRHASIASLIVVGEGPHDEAFIGHMKVLYDNRATNQKVKVESADGGSPSDIINYVVRKKHISYDRKVILMDSDIPLKQQDRDNAKKNNITLIQSTPICLEGMLLEVLGLKAPKSNDACKSKLHPRLSGSPTMKSSYASLFTKDVLDTTAKSQIVQLREYISNSKE